MYGDPANRRSNLRCEYHEDCGHLTNDCQTLRRHLVELVDQGHLSKYVREDKRKQSTLNRNPTHGKTVEKEVSGDTIHTIHGILHHNRSTNNALRAGVHSAMMTERSTFVNPDNAVTIKSFAAGETPAIAFTEEDFLGVALPHTDPLVIKVRIDVQNVERVMVDTGSSTDVIYKNLWQKMRNVKLREIEHPVAGWDNRETWSLGMTTLNVKLGPTSVPVDFVVMDIDTAYNAILGRAWIAAMNVVTSTNHQKLKFLCPAGVVTVRGSQSSARDCFRKVVAPILRSKRPIPATDVEQRLDEAAQHNTTVATKRKPEETAGASSSKQKSDK
jgi:hypothetical protein